jgi:hypothetical protein
MRGYMILLVLMLFACSSGKKQKYLEPDKMKLVTWDLIKAGELYTQKMVSDSLIRKSREETRLYAQVFAIHGITKDQFFDSYRYYEAHPGIFKTLVDSIEAYGNREKNMPVDRVLEKKPKH